MPYDDVIVIFMTITTFNTKRILIDNGSFANILFCSAFYKMSMPKDYLWNINFPLVFLRDAVTIEGVITLPVILG